jgi:hypothetical protein
MCVTNAHRIIGPVFNDDIINAARYMNNILCTIFAEPTDEERLFGVFKHVSATRMSHASLEALHEVSSHSIISHGLWPPYSLDLTTCEFHLWESSKIKCIKQIPMLWTNQETQSAEF